MRFIQASTLERLTAGSLETFAGEIAAMATDEFGEDVEIFATHEDHAFGLVGDRVVKVLFPSDTDGLRIEDVDVPVVTEANQDEFVAGELRDMALAMMGEDCADVGNRLHFLSKNLRSGGVYWASDGFSEGKKIFGTEIARLEGYDGGYDAIRGSVEDVEKIERQVPSTPYARIPRDRLESFRPELMDSMRVIADRLEVLATDMGALDDDRASSVATEAVALRGSVDSILRFSRPTDLHKIAAYHDDLAEWTKPMLVLGAFLVGEAKTGDENDAE